MFGLPLHPLVVHAAVVFLPLAALGVIGIVLVPALRKRIDWLVLLGVVVANAAAVGANLTGDQLAAQVGSPGVHEQWGQFAMFASFALAGFTLIWWFIQRGGEKTRTATRVTGLLASLAALVVIAFAVLAGHSGATAVWGAVGAPTTSATPSASDSTPSPDPSPSSPSPSASASSPSASSPSASSPSPTRTPTATPSPTASSTSPASPRSSASPARSSSAPSAAASSYSMADVEQHDSVSDCWVVVNGGVYDLTDWIGQHPGGRAAIIELCGTDATQAFDNQHDSQPNPNAELDRHRVGTLS